MELKIYKKNEQCVLLFFLITRLPCVVAASPHTSSTPNINAVRHADSRGSLISTDSANSLADKSQDKSNSLDKVKLRECSFHPPQPPLLTVLKDNYSHYLTADLL